MFLKENVFIISKIFHQSLYQSDKLFNSVIKQSIMNTRTTK